VKAVRKYFDGILIVGGGITLANQAGKITGGGADIIMIGNLLQTHGYEKALRDITETARRK